MRYERVLHKSNDHKPKKKHAVSCTSACVNARGMTHYEMSDRIGCIGWLDVYLLQLHFYSKYLASSNICYQVFLAGL